MDLYTRAVLTIIAASLAVIAVRGLASPVSPAHAAEEISCRFGNALEISSFRDDLQVTIDRPLTVEVKQAFNQPGSSRGTPVYVQMVD